MQLSGMRHGSKLLRFVGFPCSEVLGPEATEREIKALIDRHGMIFIKPIFRGGIGKKGKSGLIGKAKDLRTALAEKERLYLPRTVTATPLRKHRASRSKARSRPATRFISR
jgi:hypothetical protein